MLLPCPPPVFFAALTVSRPAQTYWDGFDPKAQSFATWAPAFYDEALAAADAEIRWLNGLLPDQVGLGLRVQGRRRQGQGQGYG